MEEMTEMGEALAKPKKARAPKPDAKVESKRTEKKHPDTCVIIGRVSMTGLERCNRAKKKILASEQYDGQGIDWGSVIDYALRVVAQDAKKKDDA